MCEYCEEKKLIHEDDTLEVEMINKKIYVQLWNTCIECESENNNTDCFKINFCPMCGRFLK
jgi:hypothetical protein